MGSTRDAGGGAARRDHARRDHARRARPVRGGRALRGLRIAAGGTVLAAVLATLLLAAGSAPVAVAQYSGATPSAAPVGGPVDPRSSGEGPGLEAEPLLVLAGVVGLGLLAVGGTLVYVRLTSDD